MIEQLKKVNIFLYGSGFLADVFMRALTLYAIEGNVIGVMTSGGGTDSFYGCKVQKFDEVIIPPNSMVCVCMHEMYKKEILPQLQKNKIKYTWFHTSDIVELVSGKAQKRGEKVKIQEILLHKVDIYGIAVRWLAMDEFYHKNKTGFDIYRRYWEAIAGKENAVKRTARFKELLNAVEREGFQDKTPLMIDKKYLTIDGNHRLAVASYLGVEKISCDIYEDLSKAFDVFREKTFLTKHRLEKSTAFTIEEKEMIYKLAKRIREK